MLLFPLAAVVGAAVGKSRGGGLANLVSHHLRAPALVWSALAMQVWLATTSPGSWSASGRFAVVVASYVAAGVWLALNAASTRVLRWAFALLALGWLLNLAAIVPNEGMPVSVAALADSGIPGDTRVDEGHLGKHVPATSSTDLSWLGDVIPARPLHSVISIGDVVMCAGMAIGVCRSMLVGGASLPAARRPQ